MTLITIGDLDGFLKLSRVVQDMGYIMEEPSWLTLIQNLVFEWSVTAEFQD